MIGESWNKLSPEERMVCLSSFLPRFQQFLTFCGFDQMVVSAPIGLSKHWAERQGKIQERVERVQGENEAGNC